MHVEAIRNAQKRWGNIPLTAQQVRWGTSLPLPGIEPQPHWTVGAPGPRAG